MEENQSQQFSQVPTPTPPPHAVDTKVIIVVLLLVFFYPVGIILMWLWMKLWPKWLKLVLSVPAFFSLILLILLVYNLIHLHNQLNSITNQYYTEQQKEKSAALTPYPTESLDVTTWKTYTNTKYQFQILYPSGLSIRESTGIPPTYPDTIRFSNEGKVGAKSDVRNLYLNILLDIYTVNPALDFKTWVMDNATQNEKNIEGGITPYTKGIMNGFMYTEEADYKNIKDPHYGKLIFFKNGNHIYEFELLGFNLKSTYMDNPNGEKILDEMISSFKANNQAIGDSSWNTYTNQQYGISFKYPSSWYPDDITSIDPTHALLAIGFFTNGATPEIGSEGNQGNALIDLYVLRNKNGSQPITITKDQFIQAGSANNIKTITVAGLPAYYYPTYKSYSIWYSNSIQINLNPYGTEAQNDVDQIIASMQINPTQ